jgi:hypothetical protein
MKQHHDNFRSLKNSTLDDEPVRRRSRGGRTGMVAAGNPDVLAEAEGKEPYDKGDERKRGGRIKRKDGGKLHRMAGGPVKARLDRPSRGRKKFADGGPADDDTTQAAPVGIVVAAKGRGAGSRRKPNQRRCHFDRTRRCGRPDGDQ